MCERNRLWSVHRRVWEVRDLLDHSRWIARHDGPRCNVPYDDRTGADECTLANDNSGKNGDIGPDLCPPADTRSGKAILCAWRQRILRVGEHHVGADPAAFLEHGELRV